jgi:N-glycosidase YbiA
VTEPLLIERGILLNFSRHGFWAVHPFRLELVWYPTNEHYFQAGKSLCVTTGDENRVIAHDLVVTASGPGEAKGVGRELSIDLCLWDNRFAPRRMLEGLMFKFTQNPDALQALLSTGDRPLVEHRRDPTWGDNMDGTGRNLMGLGLMYVRKQLGGHR